MPTTGTRPFTEDAGTRDTIELEQDPGYLRSVLGRGNGRARQIASATLARVQELMHTTYCVDSRSNSRFDQT